MAAEKRHHEPADDVTRPRGRFDGRREVDAATVRPHHDDAPIGAEAESPIGAEAETPAGHETPADHEAPGWYVPEIDDRIVLSATTDSTDGYMPVASPMPDDFDASGPVGVEVEGLDDLNL